MEFDLETLSYNKILHMLSEQAVSDAAREELLRMTPLTSEPLCRARMAETTAARAVLEALGSPPLAQTAPLDEALSLAAQGAMLVPEQLSGVSRFASTVRSLRRYLQSSARCSAAIASMRVELPELDDMAREIDRCVNEDALLDDASSLLRSLRRKRETMEQGIREKLNRLMQSLRQYLTDSYVTRRGDRFVLPVQRRYQSMVSGTVVDTSGRGSTVFVEPSAVSAMQQELDALLITIDAEERRILYELSDAVASREDDIRRALRAMTALDVLFARAKLSGMMNAREPELCCDGRIVIRQGRHPLLDAQTCVPLDFTLDGQHTAVIITGPNTGGKTVALKTVGLFCAMAQSGLHLPCGEGTVIGLTDGVFCDIGDSQSMEQNLSTFSGHMTNIIRILKSATPDSLVLLDEPGSGTDPAEGSGLAVAILEALLARRTRLLATTHDPQVKRWAEALEMVETARMAFDRDTLQPLYRLEMGQSGNSCALDIASRLGLEERLVARARALAQQSGTLSTPAWKPELPSGKTAAPHSRLRRTEVKKEGAVTAFSMGDSVLVLPEHLAGIVYSPADENGMVTVQVQGEKRQVRHNRLQLRVPASDLYPPDYDFSIIFDTVENRKAAHQMSRKFSPETRIVLREGKETDREA